MHHRLLFCLTIICSLNIKANTLRDNKASAAQLELNLFDSERHTYIYDNGPKMSSFGGMTNQYTLLTNEVTQYWKQAEPLDYESIIRTYLPTCFSDQLPLREIGPLRIIQRRDAAINSIEAHFQKYETLETNDYFQKIQIANILKQNIDIFNRSLRVLPYIINQLEELLIKIKSLESSNNILKTNLLHFLTQSKTITESVNSLTELTQQIKDPFELDILKNLISTLSTFEHSVLNNNDLSKNIIFKLENKPGDLEESLSNFKTTVMGLQSEIKNKYLDTKSSLDAIEVSILTTQNEMKILEDNVNSNIQDLSNLRLEVNSVVQNNFKIIDARVKELVIEWKKSGFKQFNQFKNYNENYFSHFMDSGSRGAKLRKLNSVQCIQ